MPARNRLLLGSAIASALGGLAATVLGLLGWPAADGTDPGSLQGLLVFTGFVSVLVGVYGLVTWYALSAPTPWAEYLALADGYADAGRVEYARTYYEEALRWGADPDEVEGRLALVEARAARRSVHRESA